MTEASSKRQTRPLNFARAERRNEIKQLEDETVGLEKIHFYKFQPKCSSTHTQLLEFVSQNLSLSILAMEFLPLNFC